MGRYSTVTKKPVKTPQFDPESNLALNEAGGVAYQKGTKEEIASLVLASLMTDKYYEKSEDTEKRLRALVRQEPYFAAQAAIYARNKHGLRSVSHVVVSEIVNVVKGESWTRRAVDKIVFRVDDMTEILALFMDRYGKRKIPNSLKRGLADAFGKFDEYQLAKYRGERNAVSLVDAVNLVHPRPTDKNCEALKKLVEGTLVSKDTWEAKLSEAGQKGKTKEEKAELKDAAWQELILNRKIGYLALLRNLRNIEAQTDPTVLQIALEMLVDPKLVKNSKIFPFQYLTAYTVISNRQIVDALNTAVDISLNNIPDLGGMTLVAVDHSGSMGYGVGSNKFIGDLFGAAFWKKNKSADIMAFGDYAAYAKLDDRDSLLSLADKIGYTNVGHSTNMADIFAKANKAYDRIVIFSDMHSWVTLEGRGYYGSNVQSDFDNYRRKYDVDPYIYAFDLSGYSTKQFSTGKTIQLGGFSDKIFDLMESFEVDPKALVNDIEKVVI